MREITGHKVNGVNDGLTINVMDEPGPGGANHVYGIKLVPAPEIGNFFAGCNIIFQKGPIKEVGVNGVTHEALLAILIDRLEGFQSGPYACNDNAEALSSLEHAKECLQRRTKARLARGVEGTMQV